MTKIYEGQFYLLMDAAVWDEPIPQVAVSEWGWSEPVFDDDGNQIGTKQIHPTWKQMEGKALGNIRTSIDKTQAIAKMQVLPPMATVGAALVQIAMQREDITLMSHGESIELMKTLNWSNQWE